MNSTVNKNLEEESDSDLGTASQIHSDLGISSQIHNDLGTASQIHNDLGTASQIHSDLGTSPLIYNDLGTASQIHSDLGISSQIHNNLGTASQIHNDLGIASQIHNDLGTASQIHNDLGIASQIHNDLGTESQIHSDLGTSPQNHSTFDPMAQIARNFEYDDSEIAMMNKARDLFVALLIEEIKERCPILVSPKESHEERSAQLEQLVIYIGCLNGCDHDFCFFFIEPATQTSMSCLLVGWRKGKYISGESGLTMLLEWKLFMDELKSFESYIYKKFVHDFIEIYRSR